MGLPTYRVLTDAEAAEQLLLSGHTPPDDVIHFVGDKLEPPPPQPAASNVPATDRRENSTDAEAVELWDAMFPPTVNKFGPVRDGHSGDETTLFQYPKDRWILFTNPSYQAAGTRHQPLTPAEAAR